MMLFLWLSWNASSQSDLVLMRINGKDVMRSEFEYSYNKNKASLTPKQATPENMWSGL